MASAAQVRILPVSDNYVLFYKSVTNIFSAVDEHQHTFCLLVEYQEVNQYHLASNM